MWTPGDLTVNRMGFGAMRAPNATRDRARRSPVHLTVHMGRTSDVVAGATVQVQGQLAADSLLHPRRLTILTGYIELK